MKQVSSFFAAALLTFVGEVSRADVVSLSSGGSVTINSTTVTCNAGTSTPQLHCQCVFRPQSGTWYVRNFSSNSTVSAADFTLDQCNDLIQTTYKNLCYY